MVIYERGVSLADQQTDMKKPRGAIEDKSKGKSKMIPFNVAQDTCV